ncbi:heterokaryon incompatibility protein-domain-containing protein [Hyaloscypha finlandica]|nr:heterokaryon incompatibility protein-domain-containing protein [Hyaloscypha finlandica]
MELVPSRCCAMADWQRHAEITELHFCMSCGFCMTSRDVWALGNAFEEIYLSQQSQPRSDDTFARIERAVAATDYQYNPLNTDQGQELRILVLNSGKFEDDLRCDLEHANLQQGPIYDALSYTWADQTGDDASSQEICCGRDREVIRITKNCETALRRMRKTDTERRLWVDSICIDQSNFDERNHQVKNMIATFRSAQRVLIYLGEGDAKVHRLLEYMAMDQAGTLPDSWDFCPLFQSRWFHRVWVLQEIAVAKNLLLTCGPSTVTWDDFVIYVKLFQRLVRKSVPRILLPPVLNYGIQTLELKANQPTAKFDLLSMLQVSRSCGCKDPRDKIYAVMGLLHAESTPPMLIDYSPSTSVGSVYLQAATWHIVKTASLGILSHVHGESKLDLPSWVPDWTLKGLKMLPSVVFRSSSVNLTPSILFQEMSPQLGVSGRMLGNVWPDTTILLGPTTNGPSTGPGAEPKRSWNVIEPEQLLDGEPHQWLLNSSPVMGNVLCQGRQDFWEKFGLFSKIRPDSKRDQICFADIPAAFGTFCDNCRRIDLLYWVTLQRAFRVLRGVTLENVSTIPQDLQKRLACTCISNNPKRRTRRYDLPPPKPSHTNSSATRIPTYWHYDEEEVEEFRQHFQEYGQGRRLFGTEYTLGFGPENIKEGDEVWQLDGATVLMVLRHDATKPEGNYKVVGECHIHAASRLHDCCILCSSEIERQPVVPIRKKREGEDAGRLSNSLARIRIEEENETFRDGSSQVICIW